MGLILLCNRRLVWSLSMAVLLCFAMACAENDNPSPEPDDTGGEPDVTPPAEPEMRPPDPNNGSENNDEREVRKADTCWLSSFTEAGAVCSRITVAIDREEPERGTIEIGMVEFAAREEPKGLPIVALVGGPGPSGSLEAGALFVDGAPLEAARDRHDIIAVDYRAVGLSEPSATCSPPDDPESTRACAEALLETGLQVSDINSARLADDVDSLLEQLDIPQAILYGGSYGTRLALTIMRDHPERVGAALLDGVFPPEVNGFSQVDDASASQLAYVVDRCAAEETCVETLGDLRAKVENFVAAQPQERAQAYLQQISRLNRHRATPLLIHSLDTADEAEIDRVLGALENLRFEDLAFPDFGDSLRDDIAHRSSSFPMALAIVCAEEAAFIDQQPPEIDQFGWSDEVLAMLIGIGSGPPFSAEVAPLVCEAFGGQSSPALEIQPVSSDIPTLIISAGTDRQTPVLWANRVAQQLNNAQHHVFPVGSHVATASDSCARDMALSFFDNPTESVDATCLTQAPSALLYTTDDIVEAFRP